MSRDILRTVRLTPYRKGHGPRFTLTTWATTRRDGRGQTLIGYELRQHGDDQTGAGLKTKTVFLGEDFAGSPLHADDSDATIASLLGFLTLRLGDTDREYFDRYTAAQLDFSNRHAETLACLVSDRFDPEGRL